MQRTKQGNMYILQGSTMTGSVSIVSQVESPASNDNSLWHPCLGHISEKRLEILSKQGILGNHKVEPLQFCKHCVFGKQHRAKFPKAMHTRKATLDFVHSNYWGPWTVPSLDFSL